MNRLGTRWWRSAYRKEPLTGFVLIVGAVDTTIGGVGGHWSLFGLGALLALGALGLRWQQLHRHRDRQERQRPALFLPPAPTARSPRESSQGPSRRSSRPASGRDRSRPLPPLPPKPAGRR